MELLTNLKVNSEALFRHPKGSVSW